MIRSLLNLGLASLYFLTSVVFAQQGTAQVDVNAALSGRPGQLPASQANALFAKQAVLRGMLGDSQIQAILRAKTDMDGLEGDYFLFGRSGKVLLAGELDGDTLFLEESENGVDVSGQWEGVMRGGEFSGTWTSYDGSVSKPFALAPSKVEKKSGTNSREPRSAAKAKPASARR